MIESERITMTFGKYKGWTLRHVFEFDPSYFAWCYYSAPQFTELIKNRSEDFIRCVKIIAYNERVRQHNKMVYSLMQPGDNYVKNPGFFIYFKDAKVHSDIPDYEVPEIDEDEDDNDKDMENNF